MSKICTDIPQSKKLIELGVNSADMCLTWVNNKWNEVVGNADKIREIQISNVEDRGEDSSIVNVIPAWSLSALEKLMPFHIIENNNRFGFYQVKGFNKQGETYRFGYKTNNNSFLFETSWYNDVIDAAFEMVCWLKKEEYI